MSAIEDRLRGLFETMTEGVVLHELVRDDEGRAVNYRIHDVNPAFTAQVGIPREAAVGKLASELYGTGQPPYLEVYAPVAETGEPASFRTYFPPMDRHFEISVFSPRADWFATVFLDITPLVKAQEQLQRERDKLRAIMEAAPVGILRIELGPHDTYGNRRAQELLGFVPGVERSQLTFPPGTRFLDESGAPLAFDDQPHQVAMRTGAPVLQKRLQLCRDGQPVSHLSVNAVPVVDEAGEPEAIIATVEDITTKVQADQERAELHQQLERMRKLESIGRLAGGIAHDFNNLLTPILGYTEMAQMQVLPGSPAAKNLDRVVHAAERARDLVGQFLAFGRKQVLEVRVCSLNTLVAEYDSVLRRLIREDIDLVLALQPGLSTCRVDPSQMEQILLNLASNAVDAMGGPGTLTIETRDVNLDRRYAASHPEVMPGDYVMLAVSDTGKGMDAATKARIFEPFFTTKESDGGTGLGLATVYGLVHQHNGHLWVYSEPDRGSTFKIYLPAIQDPEQARLDAKPRGSSREGHELVLLVEDDQEVRDLVRIILEAKGYRVLEAANSDQALEQAAAANEPIELVLSDVIVPRLNGREIFRRVQRIHPEARVLYMSGYTDNVVGSQGMLDEGIDFLQKPFSAQDLLLKVESVLDG
jgi:two-component system cell cycle sensor histidine kinase/response regulator CckA